MRPSCESFLGYKLICVNWCFSRYVQKEVAGQEERHRPALDSLNRSVFSSYVYMKVETQFSWRFPSNKFKNSTADDIFFMTFRTVSRNA